MNIFSKEFYTIMEQFGNAMTIGITHTAYFYDDDNYPEYMEDDEDDEGVEDDEGMEDDEETDEDDEETDEDDEETDDEDELNNKRLRQYDNIYTESRILFKLKNKDYGDSFADYGPIGVLMRMKDKLNRLQNITKDSVTLIDVSTSMDDETLRDTLIDLHNYSAMALMLLDE